MRSRVQRVTPNEKGFATFEFMAVVALSLAVFAVFVNFMVIQYGESAVRSSVEDAARAGGHYQPGPVDDRMAACQNRLDDLLKSIGRLGDVQSSSCVTATDAATQTTTVTATADINFKSWFDGIPDHAQKASGTAVYQVAPQ